MKGPGKYVLVYKNSGEVLSKLKDRGFLATSLSTYDFYAPNFEKVGNILLSACPSIHSCVRPFKKFLKLGF